MRSLTAIILWEWVSGYKAMNMAIEKAAETGIACILRKKTVCILVRPDTMPIWRPQKNMIGLAFSNVDANMTAPGARGIGVG